MLSEVDIVYITIVSSFTLLAVLITASLVYALYFKRNQIVHANNNKILDFKTGKVPIPDVLVA